MFSDPNHVTNKNCFIEDQGEQRHGMIGLTVKAVLFLMVFMDRTETNFREKGRQL